MIYTKDEEVVELVKNFENCVTTTAEWTHASHLTVALFYAVNHDFEDALEKMRTGIFKLNEAHGTPNTPERGYHETLTIFWLQIVFDYLEKRNDRIWSFKLANELIKTCGDPSLPLKFYSRDILFSPEARAKYLEPNLKSHAQISQ